MRRRHQADAQKQKVARNEKVFVFGLGVVGVRGAR